MRSRLLPRCALACLLSLPLLLVGAPAMAEGRLSLPADARTQEATDPGAPAALEPGWNQAQLAGRLLYFSYDRQWADSTIHLSVLSDEADEDAASFDVELATSAGDDCGGDSSGTGDGLRVVTLSTDAAVGYSSDPNPCAESDSVEVQVSGGDDADYPVWIRVVEESAASDVSSLPGPQVEEEASAVQVSGEAEDLPGSRSVIDAPLVETGIYRGEIAVGDEYAYRVRLGFGETLSVQGLVPALTGSESDEYGYGLTLAVDIRDPLLAPPEDAAAATDALTSSEAASAAAVTGPVRYRNRDPESTTAPQGPSVPGEYLVTVGLDTTSTTNDAADFSTSYTVRISVDGSPSGVPDYDQDAPFLAGGDAADDIGLGLSGAEVPATATERLLRFGGGAALLVIGVAAVGGGIVLLRRRAR